MSTNPNIHPASDERSLGQRLQPINTTAWRQYLSPAVPAPQATNPNLVGKAATEPVPDIPVMPAVFQELPIAPILSGPAEHSQAK
jgi:hypothetical protein